MMSTKLKFSFRFASPADAASIAILLNASYRGDGSKEGWTTEADLVGGERANAREVLELINSPGNHLILATKEAGEELLGCVHVREEEVETVYFGMLAVRPNLQAQGIGRALIAEVEKYTQAANRTRVRISVINFRKELIAYYRRLGFEATGKVEEFPNLNDVKVPGIVLLEFVKVLCENRS